MARKSFVVVYPDRSKKHVNASEREQLYLEGVLTKTEDPRVWRYTGEAHTFHTFAELSKLAFEAVPHRRFLPGSFIWKFKDMRRRELLETPESLGARMQTA